MTAADLLAPIRERVDAAVNDPENNRAQLAFMVRSTKDMSRILAALDGVLAVHKPVTYWMTHEDADISYQTKQDALEERTDLTEADLVPFALCGHCKTIEESPCEGECTMEAGYRESLYPCPTVAAVAAALQEGEKPFTGFPPTPLHKNKVG